jgi:hypothetical protein
MSIIKLKSGLTPQTYEKKNPQILNPQNTSFTKLEEFRGPLFSPHTKKILEPKIRHSKSKILGPDFRFHGSRIFAILKIRQPVRCLHFEDCQNPRFSWTLDLVFFCKTRVLRIFLFVCFGCNHNYLLAYGRHRKCTVTDTTFSRFMFSWKLRSSQNNVNESTSVK